MKNRFFDVDNNVYLNSLYIIVLMAYTKDTYTIEKMMLELYLMKNPKVFLDICTKYEFAMDKNLLFDFQYDNLQSEMLKYSLRIHIDGFYDALAYLYSKGLINYDGKQNHLTKTNLFMEIKLGDLPENIRALSGVINKIFDEYGIDALKKSIKQVERSYYAQ